MTRILAFAVLFVLGGVVYVRCCDTTEQDILLSKEYVHQHATSFYLSRKGNREQEHIAQTDGHYVSSVKKTHFLLHRKQSVLCRPLHPT